METSQASAPMLLRQPGAAAGVLAFALAGCWAIGVLVATLAMLGVGRFLAMGPTEIAALAAVIVLPSLMAAFAAVAVRDSGRARAEAARLADAADRLLNPQMSATAARRVAMNVRGEIASLDSALETTLARLREVEGHIARQASAVGGIAEKAKAGANQMITGMERERSELLKISQDLNNQAQAIGQSISRHTQAISQAAKQAEAEIRAADQALDHRLTSFGAAAALISDRTQGFIGAAQASADSALRLEGALANALDMLSRATGLTDSARQSAEAATLAANSTAGAVRESTDQALDDAKRAAELIRAEAVGIEREAAIALERLREAAEAARDAAAQARAAADDVAAAAIAQEGVEAPEYDNSWRRARYPLEETPRRRDVDAHPRADDRQVSGDWTWRDLLSSVDQPPAPRPRSTRTPSAAPPPRRASAPAPEPRPPVAEMLERLGVRLDQAFSRSGLERIAQRARSGTQARRRAVQDAAPQAARALTQQLNADPKAKQEAMHFLRTEGARIADLLTKGRAAMNAEATRIFLLLDAAAG